MSKYIKVKTKDGKTHVVLAANESFYKNQGAKISEPTQAEIEEAFPETKSLKPERKLGDNLENENAQLKARIAELEAEKEVKDDVDKKTTDDAKKEAEKEVKEKK